MWHVDPSRPPTAMARARKPLILAAILGGAILQHVMVARPPQLSPAPVQAPSTGPPSARATPPTTPHTP